MSDEKNKMVAFFQKLSKLAADVENGVKEVQNKMILPKCELPENSALIASVQALDSLVVLKKEMSNTEEELDKIEHSRQDFMDTFQKGMKDTERKIDELENALKKYGYVPWEPPLTDKENRDPDESNPESETTEENVASQAAEVPSTINVEQVKMEDKKRSCTPEFSVRSLGYVLRNGTNKRQNGSSKYNANDATPHLRLRSSCMRQPVGQLSTPVCFMDDVVCTPGLFIPFQQRHVRNGTPRNSNFCEPTLFTSNRRAQEMGNAYTNIQSPQFSEEDITVELFKKVKLKSSYSRKKREESITPEEPVLHSQQLIEEIRKSTKKTVAKREESITPEEPVLYSQQLIEEIRKSTKKTAATRLPINNESSTPESPELKSLQYMRKSKIYHSLFQ